MTHSSLRHAVVLAFALIAVVPLACGGGSSANSDSKSSAPAQLVYVTVDSPGGDISTVVSRLYVATPGQQPRLIREYPGHQLYEMLASPDGRYIAATDGNMVILARDGSEVMRLGLAAVSFSGAGPFASWAADSRTFAYTRMNDALAVPTASAGPPGWTEIVDVAQRSVTTSDALRETSVITPSFAPDGSRFAAARRDSGAGGTSAIVVASPGGSMKTIADNPGGIMPLWSPDGKWVAYWTQDAHVIDAGRRRDIPRAVAVVSRDGGEVRLLAEATYPFPQAWSPDGKRIALACVGPDTQATPGQQPKGAGIFLVDPESTDRTLLVDDPNAFDAAFSPDGRSVAYLTDRDTATGTFTLKTVDVETHQVRPIASGIVVGGFSWVPADGS